jgi:hypothetical protein
LGLEICTNLLSPVTTRSDYYECSKLALSFSTHTLSSLYFLMQTPNSNVCKYVWYPTLLVMIKSINLYLHDNKMWKHGLHELAHMVL